MMKCPKCGNTAQLHSDFCRITNGVMEQWKCSCGCVITKFYTHVTTYAHDKDNVLIHQELVKY